MLVHGPLVTSKTLTSYLNLFGKYCSLTNSAFWLVLMFLNDNSRTRFFPNMLPLKKFKRILTLSYLESKKSISDKTFTKTRKTPFLGFLSPSSISELFFKNLDPSFFLIYDVYFYGKSRKNWWSGDPALQADGKIDKSQIYGHFCESGYLTSFCIT